MTKAEVVAALAMELAKIFPVCAEKDYAAALDAALKEAWQESGAARAGLQEAIKGMTLLKDSREFDYSPLAAITDKAIKMFWAGVDEWEFNNRQPPEPEGFFG